MQDQVNEIGGKWWVEDFIELMIENNRLREQQDTLRGTVTQIEREIAALKKERDDFERRWLGALNVPQAIHQQEMIDGLVAIMRQIRTDLDAHDVINEWLPIIDALLAKLGADKGETK